MPLRQIAGVLYVVTALVTGYLGLRIMFSPGGSWWFLTMFGAPILLLAQGIFTVFPGVRKRWLVAFAGAVLFVNWVTFIRDFAWAYLILAVATTLITWGILALTLALKRSWVGGFAASLLLAASWTPISMYIWADYFSPNYRGASSTIFVWVVGPWLLIIASLIVGIALSKFPEPGTITKGDRALGRSAAPPTTTTH